jgi:hypothetical protein
MEEGGRGESMKSWVPVALGGMVILAYGLFYLLGSFESQGVSSFGIVNMVGLVAVFVGVVGAAIIMRRFNVPQ